MRSWGQTMPLLSRCDLRVTPHSGDKHWYVRTLHHQSGQQFVRSYFEIRSQILSCSSQIYGDTWDGNLHKLRFDRNQLQATGQSFHICVASPPDDGDGDDDDDDDDGAGDGCISIYVSPLHLVLGLTPSSQKHTETPSVLKYLDSTGYFQNIWWFLWNVFSQNNLVGAGWNVSK